jgi:hypothetical protein
VFSCSVFHMVDIDTNKVTRVFIYSLVFRGDILVDI